LNSQPLLARGRVAPVGLSERYVMRSLLESIQLSSTRAWIVGLFAAALTVGLGCRHAPNDDQPRPHPDDASSEVHLVFPDALKVDDPSVNVFVDRVIQACGGGEYEALRLLWSARDEPLPREEYEEGWHAILRIEILALEKAILERDSGTDDGERELVYAMAMRVALDPAHRAAKDEPERDAVLMLVREHDEWKVSRAPKKLRTWIKARIADRGTTPKSANESGQSHSDSD